MRGSERLRLRVFAPLALVIACADSEPDSKGMDPVELPSPSLSTPGLGSDATQTPSQTIPAAQSTVQTAPTSPASSGSATAGQPDASALTSGANPTSSGSPQPSPTSEASGAGGASAVPSGGSTGGMPSGEQGGAAGTNEAGLAGNGGLSGNDGLPGEANGRARNPIVSHIFTADPSAEVFNGRVYIYASHDPDDQAGYDMTDYHIFSSKDLVNWQDHGVGLDSVPDISWTDRLYAPDCCYSEANGKYYLYFPDSGSAIGVAVSDDPGGPFEDALGRPLIDKGFAGVEDVDWIFDPTCFIDDDGQAYLYFGGGPQDTGANARVVRLGSDMISIADDRATVIDAPDFFEASYMHKYDGKYYFSYSTSFANHAAYIDYMISDDPMTGFEYAGTVLPSPAGNNGDNNHHSIIEYRGNWYIFYHTRVLANRDGYSNYQRSITLDYLSYDASGNIVQVAAEGGEVAQLESVYAFERMEAESMADQRGLEVEFAEEAGERVGVNLTSIEDADWVGYSQVDFRDGAATFHARVASAAGGTIELYLDGCEEFAGQTGTLIGSCEVADTGGWQSWTDIECPLDQQVDAVHDLCLRFSGGAAGALLNLDHFQFE